MADRQRPYSRTLTILRVVSWPYRIPPLSWLVAVMDWLTATNRRIVAAVAVELVALAATIAWRVTGG